MFDVMWRIPARGKLWLAVGYVVTRIRWLPVVYLACITFASGIIARRKLKAILMEMFDSKAFRETPPVGLDLPQLVIAVMKTGDLTRRLGFDFMLPSFLVGTIALAMSTYLDAWSLGFVGIGVALLPLWFSVYSYWLIRNAAISLRDHSISLLVLGGILAVVLTTAPEPV